MRDFHLMLFVLALVVIDAIFITIWVYYDPLQTKEIIFDELVSAYGTQICKTISQYDLIVTFFHLIMWYARYFPYRKKILEI